MTDALSIAASGLRAAETKLSATANNIANASTTGPVPDASHPVSTVYKPLTVSLTPQAGGGVSAQVNADPNGYSLSYDPASPDANAGGFIAAPNVDLTQEVVGLIQAKTEFKANTAVIKTQDQMLGDLLNTIA